MQPLTILYQDEHLVAVHKPSGLLVHRSALARGETEFLLQRLRDQLAKRVYPVHRLDRPTSGVMVFGLSSEAAALLSEGFSERQVEKRYLAVVRGKAPEQERLDYPLREEDGTRPKAEMPAMPAMTDIRRLDSVELPVQVDRYPVARYSLVEARPLTGRRHQIRRHLSRRGYPIIGDANHGRGRHNRYFAERFGQGRLMLAATKMAFRHPVTGEPLTVSAAPEESFLEVLSIFQGFDARNQREQ